MIEDHKAEAEKLRAQGRSLNEIAVAVGVSKNTAWRWLSPNGNERQRGFSRRWKAENKARTKAYDREYAESHKHLCPKCGHQLSHTSSGKNCPGCIAKRRDEIVVWWAEGLSLREIAEKLGWTVNHLAVEVVRMRHHGYALPYRYNRRAA